MAPSMTNSIIKLTNAILLAASKKSPEAFRIRPDGETHVWEHLVAGEVIEELRGPSPMLTSVIRRMSVMASLPLHGKGEVAIGGIHIYTDEANYYFSIRVEGHGSALTLYGRVLSEAEYRLFWSG